MVPKTRSIAPAPATAHLAGFAEVFCFYGLAAGETVLGEGMATPNYSFEKRKREQAQKAAKEAKRLRKAAAKLAGTTEENAEGETQESETPLSETPHVVAAPVDLGVGGR
ncbi:MAG: hypothetical protein ACKVY0_04595 [Prosthecobacter sp.]|uniref:hypothetical protein n=1 Tax=Prosthecobacter sp. TaxID=1965333 RepID=UPI003904409A